MNKEDEMEEAKRNFLFFITQVLGLRPKKMDIAHMRFFEPLETVKPIEPVLSFQTFVDTKTNSEIYCMSITQIIKIKPNGQNI